MSREKQSVSRRRFLMGSAAFAVGAVATGVTSGIRPKNAVAAASSLPFPYQTLDVNTVRRRGYDYYFTGGCMYASARALLDTLVEVVGAPWDSIPADMFKFGKGGAINWGTLCGALNGSLAVIEIASGTAADSIGPELLGWYSKFPFPSSAHELYCKYPNQITTVADSPLCHQSVSLWCKVASATVNSPEKKDRCAKLAGDTAARAAELLNAWKAGTFAAAYQPDADFARCLPCHFGPTSRYDNEQGQLDCLECHTDKTTHHI
ncbi:C-GCAxxG-C-C family (seleno)protein [Desulfitobacterium sp.]|uniref:C-GCAxxG-C-C family (seleno)protein n=1 Tax=Desulfitobacterium sp. TaxID=49981 RepID=UPI002CF10FE1|nr:C-GCAxxG-C-C family (seleno)protein [Desulfitobacterium sp.]HVJ50132.1 C-GCAxxG-C-C family (seleno)protein [Desulfitobacterium sp.]